MKVHIVSFTAIDGGSVRGVFASHERAQEFVREEIAKRNAQEESSEREEWDWCFRWVETAAGAIRQVSPDNGKTWEGDAGSWTCDALVIEEYEVIA